MAQATFKNRNARYMASASLAVLTLSAASAVSAQVLTVDGGVTTTLTSAQNATYQSTNIGRNGSGGSLLITGGRHYLGIVEMGDGANSPAYLSISNAEVGTEQNPDWWGVNVGINSDSRVDVIDNSVLNLDGAIVLGYRGGRGVMNVSKSTINQYNNSIFAVGSESSGELNIGSEYGSTIQGNIKSVLNLQSTFLWLGTGTGGSGIVRAGTDAEVYAMLISVGLIDSASIIANKNSIIDISNDLFIATPNGSVSRSFVKALDQASIKVGGEIQIGSSFLGDRSSGDLIVSGSSSVSAGSVNLYSANSNLYIGDSVNGSAVSAGKLYTGYIWGDGGNIIFNHNTEGYEFDARIIGTVNIINAGAVKTIMTGNSPTDGVVKILDGTLQFGTGGVNGAFYGNIENDGRLIINRSLYTYYSGSITGSGINDHNGTDVLTMSGDSSLFYGTSNVNNGTVYMNGVLGGTTNVMSGASLGGLGFIGTVNVKDGGNLVGQSGDTFTINGDLNLAPGSFINAILGQPTTTGLFKVNGDVILDGAINVYDFGGFGPGLYRVIDYTGTLTDNGLDIGALPGNVDRTDIAIQLAPNQVNLINTGRGNLNYWDGPNSPDNGVVNGGSGVWKNADSFWTKFDGSVNAAWNSGFAIFQGNPGNVEVDHANGAISAEGMQFAVDGYVINGNSIELTGAESLIRVGDGTGAENITATIASELSGASQLVKTDRGALILNGTNTYTGGTRVRDGILQVSADANLGDAAGDVILEGSQLRNTQAFTTARNFTMGKGGGVFDTRADLTISGLVSGLESLTKKGAANLILLSDNSYGEGTMIEAGGLHLGNGGTTGWILGDVINMGELVFNRSDAKTFDGALSGSGRIVQQGTGVTTLTANNSALTGEHQVRAGTLTVNGILGGTMEVVKGRLQGIGTVGGTSLEAEGVIAPGNLIGRLTINGNFVGNGGLIEIETALGADNSASDLLSITGSTSGSAKVQVIDVGGTGAQTVEGIKIIDVGGASNGIFTLQGDYVFEGDPAVVGGAYAYRLYQGGVSTPNDGDWYLRSKLLQDDTGPEVPHYQPGVPSYEAYPQALLGLNGLNTLQQRVGNRSWELGGNGAGQYAVDGSDHNGAWARIEGGRSTLNPQYSDVNGKYRLNSAFIQGGYDRVVSNDVNGTVVVGASLNTAYGKTRIRSRHGDGHIKTEGYGVGLSATWYRTDGLYVDGQAQTMWYRSDLTSSLVPEKLARRNHGTGYALSAEVGRAFSMVGDWTWTPQAQLRYSSVDFSTFEDPFEVQVKMDRGNELTGRVGLGISHDNSWRAPSGTLSRAHIYGIANINYDFQSKNRVEVYDTPIQARIPRLGADVGVGGTYSWNNARYALYGEATVGTLTDDFGHSNDVRGQVGFRMNW